MTTKETIGIVGGGQLGQMLTLAAKKLGFRVFVLDPTPDSPAGQVADRQIIGSFTDREKIKELADQVDFLTFEIELANADILEELTATGKKINPSPKTLLLIKDKLRQKEFLKVHTIATADFTSAIPPSFAYPFLLKSRFDAYDGRGNAFIASPKDFAAGLKKLKGPLYAEKYVPFTKELAVMVARSTTGDIVSYPVVETTHKNHICHMVVAPAPIPQEIAEKAQNLAKQVVGHLGGAGVFGIELFLTNKREILVNEIAPRVHNSGHYTIEACKTSQFEQHIRAITGMPLGSTNMIVPAAAMVNILGERNAPASVSGTEKATAIAGVAVHMYGKKQTKIERKMGHITAVGDTAQEALRKALLAKTYITIN